jgi:S1-C subfamily serine protease
VETFSGTTGKIQRRGVERAMWTVRGRVPQCRRHSEGRPIRLILALCTLGILFSPGLSSGAKLFKWVDKSGTVHFSDRPPETGVDKEGTVEERSLKETVPEPENGKTGPPARPRNPIEYAARSIFALKSTGTSGSGFFISRKGYGITCRHVISDGMNHVAVLNDQEECGIRIIAENPENDLALILVLSSKETNPLPLRDSETLEIGERIFAIGNPAGLSSTVTDGVFTGLRKSLSTGRPVIQFSAPINPGNSGGPLIDAGGRVVGVVTSKFYSDGELPLSGLGFAVPSRCILRDYKSYME